MLFWLPFYVDHLRKTRQAKLCWWQAKLCQWLISSSKAWLCPEALHLLMIGSVPDTNSGQKYQTLVSQIHGSNRKPARNSARDSMSVEDQLCNYEYIWAEIITCVMPHSHYYTIWNFCLCSSNFRVLPKYLGKGFDVGCRLANLIGS